MKVLVIIPAYNEEKTIVKVIKEIQSYNDNVDIVVVNDGSKDNTLMQAQKTSARILNLPCNLGIGGAVQTGYIFAYKNNYDIAIQIDADGQHNPKYINQMVSYIEDQGYDLVIGSRFIEKTGYDQTFFRMLGINITSGIIKLLTGKKVYDTTSGYRAANKNIIKIFANEYPYDYPEPITNMKLILLKKKIIEISTEMRKRTEGRSSISVGKSAEYMLKVCLALFISKLKRN